MSSYMIIRAKNSEVANLMDRDVLETVNDYITWSAWQQLTDCELVKVVALDKITDVDINKIVLVISRSRANYLDYQIMEF